jgi:RNA polymerase sigma factor (sigma-70 family)
VEHREKTRILRSAVDQLPRNQRMALMLASYEGRSYREVSDIMGLSLSSVTSLIFRAKDGLRKKLLPLRVNGDI